MKNNKYKRPLFLGDLNVDVFCGRTFTHNDNILSVVGWKDKWVNTSTKKYVLTCGKCSLDVEL